MSWPRDARTGRVPPGSISTSEGLGTAVVFLRSTLRWWCCRASQREAAAAGTRWSPRCPAGEHKAAISIPGQGPCHPA